MRAYPQAGFLAEDLGRYGVRYLESPVGLRAPYFGNMFFNPRGAVPGILPPSQPFPNFGRALHELPGVWDDALPVRPIEDLAAEAAGYAHILAQIHQEHALRRNAAAMTEYLKAGRKYGEWTSSASTQGIGFSLKPPPALRRGLNEAQAALRHAEEEARRAREAAEHAAAMAAEAVAEAARRSRELAEEALRRMRDKAKEAIADLTPSPLHRLEMYLLLPPPGNFIAAYQYLKVHKDEVIRELPGSIKRIVENLENKLESVFSGQSASLGGVYFGDESYEGIGALSWRQIRTKISDAWYHKLTPGERKALIALLVVLIIINLVVLYFSGGAGLEALYHGDWSVIQASFHDFAAAVGWPTILGFFGAIAAWFKGTPAADESPANLPSLPPGPGEPGGPPLSPPPPGYEQGVTEGIAAAAAEEKKKQLKKAAAVGIPLAAAAALAAVAL